MNNKYKEVAKMFGLEFGERFKIKSKGRVILTNCSFYFDENGLRDTNCNNIWRNIFLNLLNGDYEIERLPYKPKMGNTFYYINNKDCIETTVYCGDSVDYMAIYMGNCFRTKEEAEAHKDEIMSKFKEIESNVSRN